MKKLVAIAENIHTYEAFHIFIRNNGAGKMSNNGLVDWEKLEQVKRGFRERG